MGMKGCKPGCIAKHDQTEANTTAGYCFTATDGDRADEGRSYRVEIMYEGRWRTLSGFADVDKKQANERARVWREKGEQIRILCNPDMEPM